MPDAADLDNRFTYHAPTPERVNLHELTRDACRIAATAINANAPECREKSLALTKIEEAMFWANAAIARQS